MVLKRLQKSSLERDGIEEVQHQAQLRPFPTGIELPGHLVKRHRRAHTTERDTSNTGSQVLSLDLTTDLEVVDHGYLHNKPIDLTKHSGPSLQVIDLCGTTSRVDPPCTSGARPSRGNRIAAGQWKREVQPRFCCNICYEEYTVLEMICADMNEGAPSTSSNGAGCQHYSCQGCMQQYIRAEVAGHKYPIKCPHAGCTLLLSSQNVCMLLQMFPPDLQVFRQMEVEHAIDPKLQVFCPYKDCSAFMMRFEEDNQNEASDCPHCKRPFCPSCRVSGWHEGYTCAQFQALPPEERSVEDAAMLRLATTQMWRKCPKCSMMVERTMGCSHMRCRCGADFCYRCGGLYKSRVPTAGNPHGTTSCRCGLY